MTEEKETQPTPHGSVEEAIESNFRAFLEAAPDAMVILDKDGRILLINGQAERLFGYQRCELVGRPVEDLVPARYRANHPVHRTDFFQAPRLRPMGAGLDLFAVRKDGTEFPAEISLGPVETTQGVFVTAAIRDVAERRKSERQFRGLLESAPDAMVIVNQEGQIVLVNSQTEKLFGYERRDLIGQPVEVLIPERYVKDHPSHRRRYFIEPKARAMGSNLELWARRKDGSEFPVEISLSPLETEKGTLVSSAIRDVSERKKADELRARLAAIVDSSDDAIISKSLDGTIQSWNKGAERIFGYSADEIIGKQISVLLPPGGPSEGLSLVERLKGGERSETFEAVRCRKNGEEIHVSITLSPIYDSRGHFIGASHVARDVTVHKEAEEALKRAKEATEAANRELEAFSYSVAHDLRAPLRGIDGFSLALLEDYSAKLDAEGQRYLKRVRDSAQHMAELIDSLLSLARITRADLRYQEVDLSRLAAETVERLKTTEPEREVDFVIDQGLKAMGDSRLLAVVLDNIVGNAWKFTRGRAEARVEFSAITEADRRVFLVRDNGAGFDMTYAPKLFGVFQRLHTAAEFEGTGIGLATVQRVVRRHGGRLWAEGAIGSGATFYFTLNEKEQCE